MRLTGGEAHLSYCTNIHPGETWTETEAALHRHLPEVKARFSPAAPFGVGLRLSARAAEELGQPAALVAFRDWLAAEGLYVFTINGFPYGAFHGVPVKRTVYLPDWRQPERLAYSNGLADLLAALMPDDLEEGSVSTVPGAWKGDISDKGADAGAGDAASIADALLRHTAHLHRLRETTGRTVVLGLEPEPGCLMETVGETLDFFGRFLHGAPAVDRMAELAGLSRPQAENALHRHLGVCLDTCHAAVEFEDPVETADRLLAAGIRIAKIQLSAALRLDRADAAALAGLAAFDDPVYLHQVVVRHADGRLSRYDDLPDALAASPSADEWRVHFHVPVFLENLGGDGLGGNELGGFRTTAPDLARLLDRHRISPLSRHLEVETYSFGVLPPDLRREGVVDNIVRELAWAQARLDP